MGSAVPDRSDGRSRRAGYAATVALVAVAVVMLDTAVEVLPDSGLLARLTAARLVIIVGLGALLVSGARLRDLRSPLDLPVALLLLAGTATTVLRGQDAAPLRGLLTAVAGYYLALGVLRRNADAWHALLLLALVCCAVAGAVAIAQLSQSTPTGYCRTASFADVNCRRPNVLSRSTGTFPNPNLIAAYVLLFGPFAATAAWRLRAGGERVVLLGLVVVAYGGLVSTFSRMGWFAALASAALASILMWSRGTGGRRALTVGVGVVGLVLAVLAAAAGSFGVRARAWDLGLQAWAAHPWTGVGLGRAGDVIGTGGGRIDFRHAHNVWLNWLVEAGPLALVAILAITVVAGLSAVRGARGGAAGEAAGLAALAGFFLFSLTDHPAAADRIQVTFWLTLALVMAKRVGSARGLRALGTTTEIVLPPGPATTAADPRRLGRKPA